MQVDPGPGHIVLDGDLAPPPTKGHSTRPIFGPYLLRPNGCMDQDVSWYGATPRPRRLCVRWGPRSPFPKKGGGQFSAHVYCGQTAGLMKLVLGMEVGLSPGDFVLDGDPVFRPQQRGGAPSQFSAHFCCGQTDRCIKMPLGTDVGLSPGDFVLDGDAVFPPQQTSQFSTHFHSQTAGCITMPLGREVALSPCEFVLDWDPAPLTKRGGAEPPPQF